MRDITITATVPANEEKGIKEMSGSVNVKFPETVKEAVEVYGEEAILSNALANFRVSVQGNIRGGLKRGESPDAMQARLGGAKLGVKMTGAQIDPEQAFYAKFQSSTPEEQQAMLAKLRGTASK